MKPMKIVKLAVLLSVLVPSIGLAKDFSVNLSPNDGGSLLRTLTMSRGDTLTIHSTLENGSVYFVQLESSDGSTSCFDAETAHLHLHGGFMCSPSNTFQDSIESNPEVMQFTYRGPKSSKEITVELGWF